MPGWTGQERGKKEEKNEFDLDWMLYCIVEEKRGKWSPFCTAFYGTVGLSQQEGFPKD